MNRKGSVALVTGASRGIGRAIASELGSRGLTVIGTATSDKGARSISDALMAAGIEGRGLALDVSSPDSVQAAIDTVSEQYGDPLTLVNNAGINRDNLLLRMKEQEWEEVINTNLNGVYRLARACLKGMTRARWGRIINIGSVVAASGNPGQSNYAAAKAAIEGFSRSLARETGSRGITVNVIAPGFIDTDMTRALGEKQTEALLQQIPLSRFGKPEEIAAVAGFLVSDAGAYITGETIHVNGGMYMG